MRNYSLYILVAAALSLLLIFTLVFPRYRALDYLKKEILGKEAELHSQEEHLQHLLEVSKGIQEREESISKIDSAIPKEASLPELLNFFQKTASQSGLILEEVSPIEASSGEEKDIKTTRVNITLKGYYFDFKNFLLIVEKSARLIEIENIYFSSDKLEELFTFKLSARVHSY
jgi:Tfp pilus assembly protein PilO